MVSALYSYLHTFIKWPSPEEAKATWTFIQMKHGFPKVIGAIDGTHVKIAAPKRNPECYINRKGYHSIQLQVQKNKYTYLRTCAHISFKYNYKTRKILYHGK